MTKITEKQNLEDRSKKHLTRMLSGYKTGLEQVEKAIEGLKSELEQAMNSHTEIVSAMAELREILDLPDEPDTSRMPTY